MDWEVNVRYGETRYNLYAENIYESDQIMRIKVHGNSGYIILENDYPFLMFKGSKKAIKWKLKDEGFLNIQSEKDAALVAHIISDLDYQIKGRGEKHLDRINHIKGKK